MSTAFDDIVDNHNIDSRTAGQAKRGIDAKRRNQLNKIPTPNHILAQQGVHIPGRSYISGPSEAITYPTTIHHKDDDGNTVTVHLHQGVVEDMDDAFGDFDGLGEDDNTVEWTVVGLDNGTVNLTVVGEWGKRREIDYETFANQYEPLTLADGQPRWNY